jgi:RHS repeat-associated protein
LTGIGSFNLSYQYNVAGELTNITNPWGVQVSYVYDKVGQLTSVGGSGYYGVASYLNSASYRAFGSAKQVSYANGRTLSLSYDNRLRLTQWNIQNVLGYSYSYGYFGENSGRVTFASNLNNGPSGRDASLDRSYDYDHLGRVVAAYSGTAALAHTGQGSTWGGDGPYAQDFGYDVWANLTHRGGWGGENASYNASFNSKNQRVGSSYDLAGNILSDGGQSFTYDATGQQSTASFGNSQFGYDGDGMRVKKTENGNTTYYLRSTALGGQVLCEVNSSAVWTRGFVYTGGQLLAIQQAGVTWVHQEPVTKGQRLTDSSGNVTSTVELDPWGGATNRSVNSGQQPRRYTTYERDGNQSDDALMRHYNRWWSRFDQPDPSDSSYQSADPQSLNRYSYVQNDPVNFVDPSGLAIAWVCFPMMDGNMAYGSQCGFFHFDSPIPNFPIDGNGWRDVGLNEKPKTYYVDQTILNGCTEELFGVTLKSFQETTLGSSGSFTGQGPDVINNGGNIRTFRVDNNASKYSLDDLKTIHHNLTGKIDRVTGISDPQYPWTNYTANNLPSRLEVLKTQVHELGHSLDVITGIRSRDKGIEAGFKLENCVRDRGGYKYG